MDTLKTAIVVVLLLAVLYGVYVTLNQPEQEIPQEIAWAQQQTTAPLEVDFGDGSGDATSGVTATLGDSTSWNTAQADAPQRDQPLNAQEAALANSAPAVEPPMPSAAYGPPAETTAPMNSVAAPDLISANADNSSAYGGSDMSGQSNSAATDAYSTAPAPNQTVETGQGTSIYGSGNASPPQQAQGPADTQGPPLDSTASVYAPPTGSDAPRGGYGEPAGLGGNPQMVADTEPPVADSYAAKAADAGQDAERGQIDSVIRTAQSQIEQGQYYEALLTLSFAYNAPGMSPEENQMLQRWLDPLAGKVIYSPEHLIGAPYQLQPGETLQTVAAKHNVPWQLLANINGLRDPAAVQSGSSIKVVPGPFHAEVDITEGSLTLFAGRLYAGRFAIKVNENNAPTPGEYQVNDKQPGHSFYAGNAQTLAPQDPQNPFGGIWIDLGGNVSIHSTASTEGQSERHGCISLAAKDANDLYAILSLGSNVVIRR